MRRLQIMDPNKEIENIGEIADHAETQETVLVDDFIRQLEAKEKDLHINADTTIIEIEESFDDANLPEFIKEDLQTEKSRPSPAPSRPAKTKKEHSAGIPFEKEIAGLKEKISKMQAEREELMQSTQRRAKDFESFKSRTERERNETFQNQIGNLATQMLPALDNLNRAVDFALAMPDEQRTGIQQFLDGVMLVSQQVNDVLAEMGLQQIATVGEIFDPNLHEAVATEESTEFDPNTITAELLRGYRIGKRVIRHSMVKVAMPRSDGFERTEDVARDEAVEQEESHAP